MQLLVILLVPIILGALIFFAFANKEGLSKEQKLRRFSLIVLGAMVLFVVLYWLGLL